MTFFEIAAVALVGLATTSSSLLGAALGLHVPLSRRLLACTLAFAAGSLISALAIDLGYLGALDLRHGWSRVASGNLRSLSGAEVSALLKQAGDKAGVAIILGNILDTIPGCLVIGAKYHGASSLALTLILGMFAGGIPEAAASASILRRAGYRARTVFLLWSTVLVAGLLAAVAGHVFISDPHSLPGVCCQALAGGAVLALVAHAMIPEAIHEAGSLIVMPTVAGFLFALYAAVAEAS